MAVIAFTATLTGAAGQQDEYQLAFTSRFRHPHDAIALPRALVHDLHAAVIAVEGNAGIEIGDV
jgi:hypothetical protein